MPENKKKYISPKLKSYILDKEICLVMESLPPTNPSPPPPVEKGVALPQSDPFGGDKPDYSGM